MHPPQGRVAQGFWRPRRGVMGGSKCLTGMEAPPHNPPSGEALLVYLFRSFQYTCAHCGRGA